VPNAPTGNALPRLALLAKFQPINALQAKHNFVKKPLTDVAQSLIMLGVPEARSYC
jgi:hypothetical protein